MKDFEIVKEYLSRETLDTQDIIKCYLRVFESHGNMGYDKRVYLWNLKPGDAIYVNNKFHVLLSYPRVDYTMNRKCHHDTTTCGCQPWYLYYKNENGKLKFYRPTTDGLTTIHGTDIKRILYLLSRHKQGEEIVKFYSTCTLKHILKEIRARYPQAKTLPESEAPCYHTHEQ